MAEPALNPASGDRGSDGHDLPLSPQQFNRIARLAEGLAGIILKEHKQQMINARLSRRIRALKMSSFEEYLSLLEGPKANTEVENFINSVTTNLTSFFREKHHFEHFSTQLLEPLAKSGTKRIRVWSAGCSTGEEPYTIAMTALNAKCWQSSWDFKILATDLDTNVLAHGKAGHYRADKAEAIPSEMRRWTTRGGDGIDIRQDCKKLITFRQLNLLEQWPMRGPFDAIFCRNVMIYFDADTKANLVQRYANLLAPHGVLYLGHSESLLGTHPLLTREGQTTYRRTS